MDIPTYNIMCWQIYIGSLKEIVLGAFGMLGRHWLYLNTK